MKKIYILLFALILQGSILKAQNLDQYLVHWYNFDNNYTDFVGNTALPPMYDLSPNPYVQDRFGKPNGAIELGQGCGSTYLYKDNTSTLVAGSYTISFWIYPKLLSGIVFRSFSYGIINLSLNGGGFSMTFGSGTWYTSNSACINQTNKWYHIVLVVSGMSGTVYVNNKIEFSKTINNSDFTVRDFALGQDNTGYNDACSYFDDLKIYNQAFSANEVRSLNYDIGSYVSNGTPINLAPDSTNAASFNWSTGETTPTITVTHNDIYTVSVTDNQSNTSTYSFSTYISDLNDSLYSPNAPVHSIYRNGNTVYLGGEFNYVGPVSGNAALIDESSGKFDCMMPKVNGVIKQILPDGNGGWFMAGNFSKIGSYYIPYLAHINSDKTVDYNFNLHLNGQINALTKTNSTLFVGGTFSSIENLNISNLAAIDLISKHALLWNPTCNGNVNALALYSDKLYVGGEFTSIGSQARNYLAAVDTIYAQTTSWNPAPSAKITKMVQVGTNLYVAGDFTTISGNNRNYLAYYQLTNDNLLTWNPSPNNKVNDVFEIGNTIYVCGAFTTISSQNRSYCAAYSKSSGLLTSWNPTVNGTVNAISYMNNIVYIAGTFTLVNSTTRNYIAAINASDAQLSNWNPDIHALKSQTPYVNAIYSLNGKVYVGGFFYSLGGITRNYLAALDAISGQILAWNPDPNNIVKCIYTYNSNVYIGGLFTTLNSGTVNKNYIAMLNATTGVPTGWNPNANGEILDLEIKGSNMYVAGNFSSIGGSSRNQFAELSLTFGTATIWNPSINSRVFDIAVKGDTLYLGGSFTSADAQTRNRVCSFNLSTKSLNSFNPNCNDTVFTLACLNDTIYIGGRFTTVNSQVRKKFASYNTKNNTLLSTNNNFYGISIKKIGLTNDVAYFGGNYFNSNANNASALNIKVGNQFLNYWHPEPNNEVKSIYVYQNKVYIGGKFSEIVGCYQPYFACIDNLPSFTAAVNPPFSTTFCKGTVSLSGNIGSNYTYQWYLNQSPISGANQIEYFPQQTGFYSVAVSDTVTYGTSYSNNQFVTVLSSPDTLISVTGNQNFCVTGSATLQAATGSGNTYQWYKNNSNIGGQTSSSYTATTSGQYHCEITNTASCTSISQNVIINATSITPVITNSSGITTICSGNTVSLLSDHATGNLWYRNGVSTAITTQNFTATQSGTYKCFVTDGSCTGYSQEITITVNSLPASPSITPVGTTTFCQGNSVTLNAPAGYTYLWSNNATTQSISVSTNTSYTLQVIDGNNCTSASSAPVAVTVNPLPATPTITPSGTSTFCQGGTVTLTAPNGYTYLWNNNAVTQSISATTAGNYTLQVIDGNNCISASSTPIIVTVNSLPTTPVITPNGPTTFCQGSSVTLNAPIGYTYLWSNNAITQSISVNTNASYTVQVIDGNNCTSIASASVAVIVNSLPATPTISASGSTSICQGSSVALSAPIGYTYLWSNSATTQSINATTVNNYTVQITDANNCTSVNSVPVVVTVNPLPATPTITPNGATTFCQGNSVTLNAPIGFTYLWSNGSSTQSISATIAGNYTLQVIDGNNCTSISSAPITVTVNPLPATPTITYTGSTNICQGSSITLNAPAGYYYNWSTSATTQNISVNYSGSFSVQVTDGNNCTSLSSNAVNVTVNPLPSTPTISAGGATTFCEGNNVTLSAPVGFANYNWSNGLHTQGITVTTAGSYTVQVVDNNTCTSNVSIPITVTVNTLPATPTITAGGATTFCQGGSVILNAPAGYNYLWSNSATTQSITVSINGSYSVRVIDGNICQSLSSNGITVTVNSIPTTPVITQNINTLTSSAGIGNQWCNSAGAISGATSQAYTATTDDNYYVIVTLNGCSSAQSNSIYVTVTGIEQSNSVNNKFKIYPNPVKNELIIETDNSISKHKFEIFNCIGQLVYSSEVIQKLVVNLSNFASGIYDIKVYDGENIITKKLIKE